MTSQSVTCQSVRAWPGRGNSRLNFAAGIVLGTILAGAASALAATVSGSVATLASGEGLTVKCVTTVVPSEPPPARRGAPSPDCTRCGRYCC